MKYLLTLLLLGVCLAQNQVDNSKQKDLNGNYFSHISKNVIIQIGGIDEFVFDQRYPVKKQSAYGKIIVQQGRLDEFVLDQRYPVKKQSGSIGSNFKIIIDY